MEKNEFLAKACDLFLEHGAKTLTMDDVSKAFGISKKTLYTKYRNKEELIEAVLHYKLDEVIAKLQLQNQQIDCAVERMFCRDEDIDELANSNNSLLIKQLIRYYPAIFSQHMIEFSHKFAEVLIHNIEKGRQQGVYREDFDAEVYAKLFFQLVMSLESSPFMDSAEIDLVHYKKETMHFYMNAITTEEGKKLLKKYK